MISGKDFIVFSDDWGRHPFSCQHIMKHLLPHNRVLWVNTIMRNPKLTLYDLRRGVNKVASWLLTDNKSGQPDGQSPLIASPFMLPYADINLFREFNRLSVINKVRSIMKNMDVKTPIFVITVPNAADYVDAFSESMIVYYCVDDFVHWPGINMNLIRSMEEHLIDKSDLVFASSAELCKKKKRGNKSPIFLPHGVDFEKFNISRDSVTMSAALANLQTPIIGFFGAISPWIDFELIEYIADKKPDWSFVFVGPADVDTSLLNSKKNIYFVGRVPYEELSGIAVFFDVAIIPFLINEMTVCVNPLKLLEYFACGLPVVSTDMPEVRKFEDMTYIAKDYQSFLEQLETALEENSEILQEKRRMTAKKYSWESIAEEFCMQIDNFQKTASHCKEY